MKIKTIKPTINPLVLDDLSEVTVYVYAKSKLVNDIIYATTNRGLIKLYENEDVISHWEDDETQLSNKIKTILNT